MSRTLTHGPLDKHFDLTAGEAGQDGAWKVDSAALALDLPEGVEYGATWSAV